MNSKPQNYPNEPKYLFDYFYQITQIPRPSGREGKIREYLINLAQNKGLEYNLDSGGNVVIYLPATPGYENNPPVIIQNHMDMVCDAEKGHEIDFENVPLTLQVDGDWLKAKKTTLGADNGLGMAVALATIDDPTIKHPPLELLFTADEETGLHGALNLDVSFLKGRKLINLDSEDWGYIFVGCAGGITVNMKKKLAERPSTGNLQGYQIELKGFIGGHSGIDINKQLASALVMLSYLLNQMEEEFHFELSSFEGGVAHNIIPREAKCTLLTQEENLAKINTIIEKAKKEWKSYLPKEDQNFSILVSKVERPKEVLKSEEVRSILALITQIPHGAHAYHLEGVPPYTVSLSSNWARARIDASSRAMFHEISLRFFERNESLQLIQKIRKLAQTFNVELIMEGEYPSWKPQFSNNHLLELSQKLFNQMNGHDPQVKAIHAGLECGIIQDKFKGQPFQAISIGPNIRMAHSPGEKVQISSVKIFMDYYKLLLSHL